MNWFSVAAAFGLAAILPCTLIFAVAWLLQVKEDRLATKIPKVGLSQRHILLWTFSLGTALGISTLAPVPFAFIIILDSAVFGIAIALSAWNAATPFAASLTAVAASMLATASVVTLLTVIGQRLYGFGVPDLFNNLLALWITFALPGLALGLTAGVIKRLADKERFPDLQHSNSLNSPLESGKRYEQERPQRMAPNTQLSAKPSLTAH